MRVTMIDRWLIMMALICFLLLAAPEGAYGATCDQNCRHVKIYQVDLGAFTDCWHLQDGDCRPCTPARNGFCADTNLPGVGTCTKENGNQKVAFATGCSAVCTIVPPLAWFEAKGGTPGMFVNTGGLQCE
ncbi:MAG: hypothetical protein ACRC33_09350 [Gemmataceae bacterium]